MGVNWTPVDMVTFVTLDMDSWSDECDHVNTFIFEYHSHTSETEHLIFRSYPIMIFQIKNVI